MNFFWKQILRRSLWIALNELNGVENTVFDKHSIQMQTSKNKDPRHNVFSHRVLICLIKWGILNWSVLTIWNIGLFLKNNNTTQKNYFIINKEYPLGLPFLKSHAKYFSLKFLVPGYKTCIVIKYYRPSWIS